MKWRVIGVLLLLLSLLLAALEFTESPIIGRSNVAFEKHGIPVVYVFAGGELAGPFFPEWNVTLNPLNKAQYVVEALVQATVLNSTSTSIKVGNDTLIDFWVVNKTGSKLLYDYLNNGTYYSWVGNTTSLPGVRAYAKGLNVGGFGRVLVSFEGVDYDGTYTVALINPHSFVNVANVSVTIEESWRLMGHIIEPNLVSVPVTVLLAFSGVYMAVKNPSWLSKEAKRRRKRR